LEAYHIVPISKSELSWATKLEEFINNPELVFRIIKNLVEDEIKFVKKSVGNLIADYLKVNPIYTFEFLKKYENSTDKNTQCKTKYK